MRDALGEFEQMVLLAILHVGEDVYGVPIVDEIARRTGREVAPAAVYVTLRRLEEKGLVSSWMGESTAERGGKARRYVRVTRAGRESLRASRRTLDSMWRGLDIDLPKDQHAAMKEHPDHISEVALDRRPFLVSLHVLPHAHQPRGRSRGGVQPKEQGAQRNRGSIDGKPSDQAVEENRACPLVK